jgi:beta-barrel assembly-enhancing protease
MAKASFQALAFHPDFGNEAVEGDLYFSTLSLTFRNSEGETVFQIPIQRLVVTVEDAGEGRVLFRDSQQSDLAITTSDMEALELTAVAPIARVNEQLTARLTRQELGRRVKIVAWFGIAAAVVLWLAMVAVGVMVRSIAARLPPEFEKQQGAALLVELKLESKLTGATSEVARLTTIAQPLLRSASGTQEWQFYIIPEESPNAFALPGGHIVVTEGLMKLASGPEELLGVIAHEMAHLTRKHSFRQGIASAGPLFVLQLFFKGRNEAAAIAAGASALLVSQSFSQEYEKEADDFGWNYLVAANIDPRGSIEMLRKMKGIDATFKDQQVMAKAFSSHPDLDKRIARLEKKWKRLPRKSSFIDLNADVPP